MQRILIYISKSKENNTNASSFQSAQTRIVLLIFIVQHDSWYWTPCVLTLILTARIHLIVDIDHHHTSQGEHHTFHCWHRPPPCISISTHFKRVKIKTVQCIFVFNIFDNTARFQKGHDPAYFSFYICVCQTQVCSYPWQSSTNREDTIWIDHSRWSLVLLGECDRVIQMSDHERLLLPQGSGLRFDSNPE